MRCGCVRQKLKIPGYVVEVCLQYTLTKYIPGCAWVCAATNENPGICDAICSYSGIFVTRDDVVKVARVKYFIVVTEFLQSLAFRLVSLRSENSRRDDEKSSGAY